MHFFFFNGEEKKCTYSPWVSCFVFFSTVVKSEISHPTVRKTRLSPRGQRRRTSLVNMMEEKKMWQAAWRDAVWKGKACGWRTSEASQRTFSLEDKSSPLCVKLKVDISPLVRNFVRAESPDLPSLPRPAPHPSPPWPLIILLNWNPHLSSQKQELFKQTTLTTTLESYFHAQKFEKSFFFLTPWGVGVIPFTNMQTEGTVGGGDKMIQLMLHNRGWIWTKAKLCFLDFMLPLTATCIFLSIDRSIETDCIKKVIFFFCCSLSWKKQIMRWRTTGHQHVALDGEAAELPRIPLIQIISADQGSLILIRQHLKGVSFSFPIFFLLTP